MPHYVAPFSRTLSQVRWTVPHKGAYYGGCNCNFRSLHGRILDPRHKVGLAAPTTHRPQPTAHTTRRPFCCCWWQVKSDFTVQHKGIKLQTQWKLFCVGDASQKLWPYGDLKPNIDIYEPPEPKDRHNDKVLPEGQHVSVRPLVLKVAPSFVCNEPLTA